MSTTLCIAVVRNIHENTVCAILIPQMTARLKLEVGSITSWGPEFDENGRSVFGENRYVISAIPFLASLMSSQNSKR